MPLGKLSVFCIRYFSKTKCRPAKKIAGQCFSTQVKAACTHSANLKRETEITKIVTYPLFPLAFSYGLLANTIRVHTLFQKKTFPGLSFLGPFQDSDLFFKDCKSQINRYTPMILMFTLLTAFHTLFLFSYTDFQNFPGPVAFFRDFPVLENVRIKFQDFPGFPGPIRTLTINLLQDHQPEKNISSKVRCWKSLKSSCGWSCKNIPRWWTYGDSQPGLSWVTWKQGPKADGFRFLSQLYRYNMDQGSLYM